jgi:hypothetical protein
MVGIDGVPLLMTTILPNVYQMHSKRIIMTLSACRRCVDEGHAEATRNKGILDPYNAFCRIVCQNPVKFEVDMASFWLRFGIDLKLIRNRSQLQLELELGCSCDSIPTHLRYTMKCCHAEEQHHRTHIGPILETRTRLKLDVCYLPGNSLERTW